MRHPLSGAIDAKDLLWAHGVWPMAHRHDLALPCRLPCRRGFAITAPACLGGVRLIPLGQTAGRCCWRDSGDDCHGRRATLGRISDDMTSFPGQERRDHPSGRAHHTPVYSLSKMSWPRDITVTSRLTSCAATAARRRPSALPSAVTDLRPAGC